jgi:hypothetical protein
MFVLGIDIGAAGAVAVLSAEGELVTIEITFLECIVLIEIARLPKAAHFIRGELNCLASCKHLSGGPDSYSNRRIMPVAPIPLISTAVSFLENKPSPSLHTAQHKF